MIAKFVNEAIKHLEARSSKEIINNTAHENIYTRFLTGLQYNIEELVEEAFNENKLKVADPDTDPIYLLGSYFLTNEELSFRQSGSWYFTEGKMYCKKWEGEYDELCEDFINFIENHNIKYKRLSKESYFNVYVEFTGKARDIIQLVLTYFGDINNAPKYVIETLYEIIFQG